MTSLTLDCYHHLQDLVKALESGEYKQCYNRLRVGDCYCVMGVACDLYDSSRWIDRCGTKFYSYKQDDDEYPEAYVANCPMYVAEYFGFTNPQLSMLTQLNDNYKYTFKEIAEWIKRNVIRSESEIYKD